MDTETQVLHRDVPAPSRDDRAAGACFCGAVAVEVTGSPVEMGYCHCDSCRAYSGAPMSAFTLWKADQVRITRGAEHLGGFNKTGFSNRRFCTNCGGHVMVEHPGFGFTDVSPGVLPTITFVPAMHLNCRDAVLPVRDGLPRFSDFPAEAGGSGELLSD